MAKIELPESSASVAEPLRALMCDRRDDHARDHCADRSLKMQIIFTRTPSLVFVVDDPDAPDFGMTVDQATGSRWRHERD